MLRPIFALLVSARHKGAALSRFLVTLAALAVLAACNSAPIQDTYEEPAELGTVSSALLTLNSLSVSPPTASLPAGLTQLFKASGLYSDGRTRTLTSGITWSSSDTAIASIAADGTALTVSPGVVTITALHPATGIRATATLTVTSETLVSVAVSPASRSVGIGATVSYVATAKFSAGTSVALKGSVVAWSSTRATISAAGKIVTTAADEGLSTITARHVPTGRDSAGAQLFVSSSPLTSITVTPLAPRMPKGTIQRFTATGVLANGMTSDLTASAVWTTSKATVATLTATGSPAVIDVTAVGVGTAAIRAKFGTITGSSTVTVPAAVLTSLAITPPNPRVLLGTSPKLVAMGTYDDLTTVNRTEFVTWSSSATSIVKVSTAAGSRGTLTPVKVGTATITARDAATLVTTTTLVTVTNVTLVGLSITPATPDAPLGTTVAFHATGNYSDATTQDLTTSVTWSSASANANVSNASPTQGVATANAVGSTTITAQLGALSAAATLNVTPARLVRLEMVSPTVSLIRDLSQQLDVNGIYTDGSTVNLNTAVGWSSSDPAVASVSNEVESQGVLTALGVGSATITATDPVSGLSATTAATVTAPTLVQINLQGPQIQYPLRTVRIPRGVPASALAVGVYSHGYYVIINEACTWTSSDPSVMVVSNVPGEKGKLTGGALGSATITATEPVSGVTQSLVFETIAPRLLDFSIPAAPELVVGQTLAITTGGKFGDGTAGPVDVTWALNGDPTLASIDSDPASTQSTVKLTALRPGQVELWASSSEVGSRSIMVNIVASEGVQLVAGLNHACALIPDLGVKCWGDNAQGRLGLGDLTNRPTPSVLAPIALGIGAVPKQISAGYFHTCVLLQDGAVKCWGFNGYGQLGQGDTLVRGGLPNQMGDALPPVDLGGPAKAVVAGDYHTCAILLDGRVKCWGIGGFLGLGDNDHRGDQPNELGVQLPAVDLGTGRTAKRIFAGYLATCAILDDDTTKCWGLNNQFGGMGFAPVANASQQVFGDFPGEMGDALPVVTFNGLGASTLNLSGESGCARLTDGAAKCFGYNKSTGALGLGDRESYWKNSDNKPVLDFGANRTVKAIATGFENACAILDDDGLKCWGRGGEGALGYGDTTTRGDDPGEMGDVLPYVDLGSGRTAKRLAVGDRFACAVLDNDRIKCWGDNTYGQLGLGDNQTRGNQPGQMGDALPYVELVTCVAPPNGLASWWRADGDATDRQHVRDASGVPNASFTPGKVGSSFLFSGGTYVTAPSAGLPLGASDRTLEAWVRLDALTANGGEAFFAGYGAFGTGGGSFGLGASGAQVFFSQWGQGLMGPVLPLGTWTHLAAVSTGPVVALYVNGNKVSETAMFVQTQPGDFVIGAIPGDPYRRLDGAVDEVSVYDRALTAQEVSGIYAAGAAGKCH
jgi:uncharacterized protein YjdB